MTEDGPYELLGILKTAYPRFYADADMQKADEAAGLWGEMLSDVDDVTAAAALKSLIATCKFPPTVAEMREKVAEVKYQSLPGAGAAWASVNAMIGRFGYYRQKEALESMDEITRKVSEQMGWQQLCMSRVEDEMANRAHFFKIYATVSSRIEQDRMLPDSLRNQLTDLSKKLSMEGAIGLSDGAGKKPALSVIVNDGYDGDGYSDEDMAL